MKLLRRVFGNAANGQKLVTIPNCVTIKPGDYVYIEEVSEVS